MFALGDVHTVIIWSVAASPQYHVSIGVPFGLKNRHDPFRIDTEKAVRMLY